MNIEIILYSNVCTALYPCQTSFTNMAVTTTLCNPYLKCLLNARQITAESLRCSLGQADLETLPQKGYQSTEARMKQQLIKAVTSFYNFQSDGAKDFQTTQLTCCKNNNRPVIVLKRCGFENTP